VELAQATRLEGNVGRGNSLADGEVGRVDLAEFTSASADLLGIVLEGAVDKGGISGGIGVGGILNVAVGDGAIDNVRAALAKLVKDLLVNTKVLGQNILGCV
jgi:hypothetical protein